MTTKTESQKVIWNTTMCPLVEMTRVQPSMATRRLTLTKTDLSSAFTRRKNSHRKTITRRNQLFEGLRSVFLNNHHVLLLSKCSYTTLARVPVSTNTYFRLLSMNSGRGTVQTSDEFILYICIEVDIVGRGGLTIEYFPKDICRVYETDTVDMFPGFCFCSLPKIFR